MGQVHDTFTVCDQCQGIIPTGADRIQGVNGSLVIGGSVVGAFSDLDFCCTQHMGIWIQTQPPVAVPNPPYPQPPAIP